MRVDARIGAIDDRDTGCMCASESLPLRFRGFEVLAQELLGPVLPATFGVDVIAVVDVHRQRDIASLRKRDAFVIDQRCMLDGIDARENCFLDRACTVRMGGNTLSGSVSHLDDGANLIRRHLRLTRHAAERQHRPGRDHLQHVRAAIDSLLSLAPELIGPTRDASVKDGRDLLRRNIGDTQIAAAIGNRQIEAADLQVRTRHLACIDRIAQIAIRPRVIDADITNARESCEQCGPRLLGRERLLFFLRTPQVHGHIVGVGRHLGDVIVHLDQSRQACVIAQIE